jgi:hypothetical protein
MLQRHCHDLSREGFGKSEELELVPVGVGGPIYRLVARGDLNSSARHRCRDRP